MFSLFAMGRIPTKSGTLRPLLKAWTGFLVLLWCATSLGIAQLPINCPELPQLNLTRNGTKVVAVRLEPLSPSETNETTCICSPVYKDEQSTKVNCSNPSFREATCYLLPSDTADFTEVELVREVLLDNADLCLFSECGRNNCAIFDASQYSLVSISALNETFVNSSVVSLSWNTSGGLGAPVTEFNVTWCTEDNNCSVETTCQEKPTLTFVREVSGTSVDIQHSKPAASLRVRVSPIGFPGNFSHGCFETPPEELAPIASIKSTVNGLDQLRISWTVPSGYNDSSHQVEVRYCVGKDDVGCPSDQQSNLNRCPNIRTGTVKKGGSYDVTGLEPGSFIVLGMTTTRLYPSGVQVRSPETLDCFKAFVPGSVTDVAVQDIRSRNVSLLWNFEQENPNPTPASYNVSWCAVSGEKNLPKDCATTTCEGGIEKSANTLERAITIPDLTPWKDMSVKVWALYSNGSAEISLGPPGVTCFRTLAEAPEDVKDLRVNTAEATRATVVWKKPDTANGPLDGYVFTWCGGNNTEKHRCDGGTSGKITVNSSSITEYTLDGLHPWTTYRVTVAAFNRDEEGAEMLSNGNTVVVATDAAAPEEVKEFRANIVKSTAATVVWKKPERANGPLDGYIFTWCPENDVGKSACAEGTSQKITVNSSSITEYTFDRLNPWTKYTVTVAAFNRDKDGAEMASAESTVLVETYAAAPEEVKEARASTVEATRATLVWKKPERTNGPLDGYILTWCPGNDTRKSGCAEGASQRITVNSSSITEYTFDGLNPWANYRVTVAAFNRDKDGAEMASAENAVMIATDASAPGAVVALSKAEVTNHSLSLTWDTPGSTGGNLHHYEITYCATESCRRTQTVSDNINWSSGKCKTVNATSTEAKLVGLHPWTWIAVRVIAVSMMKNGTELLGGAAGICERTKMGVPGKPEDVIVKAERYTVVLSWKPPTAPNGEIASYKMEICQAGNDTCETLKRSGSETTGVGKTLLPWTSYIVSLAAQNIEDGIVLEGEAVTTTVKTLPAAASEPLNLAVSEGVRTIDVQWNEPDQPRGPLSGYDVSWKTTDWLGRTIENDSLTTTDREAQLPGWKAYSNYTVSVRAFHDLEDGSHLYGDKVSTSFVTAVDAPGEPVVETEVGARYAAVYFSVPDSPNGPLDGFLWTNCPAAKEKERETCANETKTEKQLLLLAELKPWTDYTFGVRAYNLGPGETQLVGKKKLTTYKTNPAEPSAVRNFSVARSESRTLFVNWSQPAEKNGELAGYVLSWRLINGTEVNHKDVMTRSVALRFLQPYTDYSIEVLAYNEYLNDRLEGPSATISARTLPEAPGPVRNLEAEAFSNNTVRLTWSPPLEPRGKLKKYVVIYNCTKPGKPSKSTVEIEGDSLLISNVCHEAECTFEVEDLAAEYTYSFDVRGENYDAHGLGDPFGSPRIVQVPAGDPPPTKNISLVTADCPSARQPDTQKTFVLSRDLFDERNGNIVYYEVVIGSAERISENVTTGLAWKELSRKQPTPPHVITPKHWNPFKKGENTDDPLNCQAMRGQADSVVCTIGWERCDSKGKEPCNGPLKGGTEYAFYVIGHTQGGSRPSNPEVFVTALPLETSSAGAIIGGILAAIVITGAAFVVLILHRRRLSRQKQANPKRSSTDTTNMNNSFVHLVPMSDINGSPRKPSPPVLPEEPIEMEHHVIKDINKPIPKTEFKDHLQMMLKDSAYRFADEYERLVELSPQYSSDVARNPANSKKNRFTNIHPFDKSRVPLSVVGEDEQTSYINASFVKGCKSDREYIAAQGPNALTVSDFWRMVWEHDVKTIIMLTQFVEANKKKCEKYWPDDNKEHPYGSVLVRKDSSTELQDYILTEFRIKSDDSSKWRSVRHVFFTAWKDHGVPEKPETLIRFVRTCQGMFGRRLGTQPPIVVHCSAGVGRTGTFIALDMCLQKLEVEDEIDIFHLVLDLRECRRCMVQNEKQYTYLYHCVAAVIDEMTGNTVQNEPIYENVGALLSGSSC